jgi:ferredoxin
MTADPVPAELAAGGREEQDGTRGREEQDGTGEVTILLDRKKTIVPKVPGETLLETARRAGLTPPFSCEAGNCGTCMAKLTEGSATMRVNDALMDDEVEDGYVLTCQAVPDAGNVTVDYEE